MHPSHCTTPADRIRLASSMLAYEGTYGFVSQLSREHDISRQSLYIFKSRGREAMERKFCIKEQLTEWKSQIERIVLTLFTESHASREGIQEVIGMEVENK